MLRSLLLKPLKFSKELNALTAMDNWRKGGILSACNSRTLKKRREL